MQAISVPTDYKQLLSRLCHLVALSETKKIEGVIDSLIIQVIEFDPSNPANDKTKIEESLKIYFGIILDSKDLEKSLSRLQCSGDLLMEPNNGSFVLSPAARAAHMKRVEEASDLEARVKADWMASIQSSFRTLDAAEQAELLNCLSVYLTKLFRRHGAQTALLTTDQPLLMKHCKNRYVTFYLLQSKKNVKK